MVQSGRPPWRQPWEGGNGSPFSLPRNGTTGNRYNGFNIPILWDAADKKGYQTHNWASYKQWAEQGKQVRRGEKGTQIGYYNTLIKEDGDDEKKIPFLRVSSVFNEQQLEGFKPPQIIERPSLVERLDNVEQFIGNIGADIRYGGERAFYSITGDYIQMPPKVLFISSKHQTATEGFYSTELHELGHLTGHKSRCDRQFGKRFGSEAYAFEELVAENCSAICCAELGITDGPQPHHADYLANWMEMGRLDSTMFMKAWSEASKAFAWMEMQQTKGEMLNTISKAVGGPRL
ncbi:ssDNA-binding domain-containing protein [Hymenobacter sp. HSC-4F20]|nr:ssDNA-binding domain-containing protein [Hymenobacter sp. HSC-4F20]